jgi:hypothetical protein
MSFLCGFPVGFVFYWADDIANDTAGARHGAETADGFERTRRDNLCHRMTEASYQDGFASLAYALQKPPDTSL